MRKNIERVLIKEFDETQLGLPYPIKIINGVWRLVDKDTGEEVGTASVNVDALYKLIVIHRCALPNALVGEEIKFIRNVRNIKSKDMAAELGISAETFSRIENNNATLTESVERLIRVYSCLELSKEDGMPDVNESILRTMGRRVAFSEDNQPNITFELHQSSTAEDVWRDAEAA